MSEESACAEIVDILRRLGLIAPGEMPEMEPLTGGVSSDIWRVVLPQRVICVKRALAKLKVAADWRAPVARNAHEVAWFEVAGRFAPAAVPEILAHDAQAGLFAMAYLDPAEYRLWKAELMDGRAERQAAAAVARTLAAIHAGTAGDGEVAARFATDETFHAIRLEPYLEATARAHPECADTLMALSTRTAETKKALVHGDVSPKNILLGPDGPVFLDAECAWYGDPAFDAAFCLNHLLLKCLWRPDLKEKYLACFGAFGRSYLANVDWENPDVLEARIATLLPGLFLARVDGKSPVEYVTDDAAKESVRRVALALLARPVQRLQDISAAWEKELDA
ncbi:MAG: phosphotransferase [Rickettsiales bacterium]|jgi:aminoglycoside phosphotransferase (APT) family kinase protein